jgi:ribosomal protein S18 acetylase RimI-like enzyme
MTAEDQEQLGSLLIRPYLESDEVDVIALWHEAFPNDPPWKSPAALISRKIGVQRELFLVGEYQGRVVATVITAFDGVCGWIYRLAVVSRERHQGRGRAMMIEAEKQLRELGCPKINLQVRASNAEVVKFYRALGYAVEERISMGKRLE